MNYFAGDSMKQLHHIIYDKDLPNGGWTVELNGFQHRTITAMQRCNPTPENYAAAINFLHAVMFEVNRLRMELDTQTDD